MQEKDDKNDQGTSKVSLYTLKYLKVHYVGSCIVGEVTHVSKAIEMTNKEGARINDNYLVDECE